MPCTLCPLHLGGCKTNCLSGHGGAVANKASGRYKYFLIGEAPGEEEDRSGIPFIGRSGRLLRRCLQDLGIEGDCWITNAVRCRPPGNKTPTTIQLRTCRKYLLEELARIQPDIIVTLGVSALKSLTGVENAKLNEWRTNRSYHWDPEEHQNYLPTHESDDSFPVIGKHAIPVICTFHPAAILRSPELLPQFAQDLERLISREFLQPETLKWQEVQIVHKLPKVLALDVETTGLNAFTKDGQILSVAWSGKKDVACVTQNVQAFSDALQTQQPVIIGHNLKFDLHWLRKYGYRCTNDIYDTYIACHLLDENRPSKGLKALALEMTGYGDYSRGVAAQRDSGNMQAADLQTLLKYNAYDAAATWKIWKDFMPELDKEKLLSVYRTQMRALATLQEMESTGMPISRSALEGLTASTQSQIRKLSKLLQRALAALPMEWQEGDLPLNLGSNVKLGWLLFSVLGFRPLRRTAGGKAGVGKADLVGLAIQVDERARALEMKPRTLHSFLERLLELRQLRKTLGTYLSGKEFILDENDRVHPSYNLAGTVTGRASCSRPNLQNIPRGSTSPVKEIFVAPPGKVLVSADYSQIELRLGAFITRDSRMLETLRQGADLHTETARAIYEHEPSQEERQRAKTVNFGVFYGMGPHRLAAAEKMPLPTAQGFLREWHRLYPGVRAWQREQEAVLKDLGYLTSAFGRRRRLPLELAQDPETYKHMLRMACNFPIQGMAGELTLMAGVLVHREARALGGSLVLNVHDQLMAEVPQGTEKHMAGRMAQTMENASGICTEFGYKIHIDVPTPVEVSIGTCWANLEPWKGKGGST
jgi:uracil-DNA glycosylase family 4